MGKDARSPLISLADYERAAEASMNAGAHGYAFGGARAVMVGRPVLWGLAVGGTEGATRVLEILLGEFDRALALSGAPNATDLDRSFVCAAPWVVPGT